MAHNDAGAVFQDAADLPGQTEPHKARSVSYRPQSLHMPEQTHLPIMFNRKRYASVQFGNPPEDTIREDIVIKRKDSPTLLLRRKRLPPIPPLRTVSRLQYSASEITSSRMSARPHIGTIHSRPAVRSISSSDHTSTGSADQASQTIPLVSRGIWQPEQHVSRIPTCRRDHFSNPPEPNWCPVVVNLALYLLLPFSACCSLPGLVYGLCAYVDLSSSPPDAVFSLRRKRGHLKNRVAIICSVLALLSALLVIFLLIVFWSKISRLLVFPDNDPNDL